MLKEEIEGYHLSPQQAELWLWQPDGPTDGLQCALFIEGTLQTNILEQALQDIVAGHEILRTAFQRLPGMSTPLQVMVEENEFLLEQVNLGAENERAQEESFEQCYLNLRERRFRYDRGEMMYGSLLRLAGDRHVLLLSLSALCADVWSMRNLIAEVGLSYAARTNGQKYLRETVQYLQFAAWQNDLLEAADRETQRSYWRQWRTHKFPVLRLPFDEISSSTDRSAKHQTRICGLELEGATVSALERLAAGQHIGVETFLLACWQLLLWRLTGCADVLIETACNGRKYNEVREAIGLYVKWLPLHCCFKEDSSFIDILKAVESSIREASTRHEYFTHRPLEDAENPERNSSAIGFECERWPTHQNIAGLSLTTTRFNNWIERFNLRLSCWLQRNRWQLQFYYDPERYSAAAIQRLASEYRTVLRSVSHNPWCKVGAVDVLGDEERRLILKEWSKAATHEVENVCLQRLFEEQVEKTRESEAVIFEGQSLTYGELNCRANELAHYLRLHGVGPEVRVGILLEPSAQVIVAILGVLKAGGAYVPLDVSSPPGRLSWMLSNVGARLVLTQASLLDSLPRSVPMICLDLDREVIAGHDTRNPGSDARVDNLAYVIYTSGSTGKPKAVMICRRSVVNLWGALQHAVYSRYAGPLRVACNAPLCFDASVKQIIQLFSGHTLCVVPAEARRDGFALRAWVERNRVEVLDCTLSQLRLLLAAGLDRASSSTLRVVLLGGEAIDEAAWQQLRRSPRTSYFNLYGPTECTVDATACLVQETVRPVIGRPLANTRAYILDRNYEPVPIGVVGELHLGGEGVARGYYNSPGLTAEKFIADPFNVKSGSRLYRTGDLARYLPSGEIEYIGRIDHQIKVRGFRIELGEVEAALNAHPAVSQSVVVVREDEPGDKRLIAYTVAALKYASTIEGRARYELPNHVRIVHQNRNETDYLYDEIFEKQTYLKHGLTLPAKACVFDVGANIGMFSLWVAERCRAARIYAFEPLPPLFETLRINAELYGENMKVFQLGMSDHERVERFTYYPRYTMMSGQTDYADAAAEVRVVARYLRNHEQRGQLEARRLGEYAEELLTERFAAEHHQCRLRRLSDVMREEAVERVDLLKIDVQRAELDVLRGVESEDWQKIKQVVMEVHDCPGDKTEGRTKIITDLLKQQGFDVCIDQDELLQGTDRYMLYAARRLELQRSNRDVEVDTQASLKERHAPLFTSGMLRSYLKEILPEYMIPSAFVFLAELPLTRSGKVNREALPALKGTAGASASNYVAPRTKPERIIANIWQQALRVERVGLNENFFDLGGHSILLVQVHSRLRETLQRDFPLVELFRHPTVDSLAKYLCESEPDARALAELAPRRRTANGSSRGRRRFMRERRQFR